MDITITCRDNDREKIIADVTYRINLTADCMLDWKIERFGEAISAKADCNSHIAMVEDSLDKLLELYPVLDISASYTLTVREDDSSAQWWESVSISTEKKSDGTGYLKKSSGTYWN